MPFGGPVREGLHLHLMRFQSPAFAIGSQAGVPDDPVDPRHHGFRGSIRVALTMNADPVILKQILGLITRCPGSTEIAKKWR